MFIMHNHNIPVLSPISHLESFLRACKLAVSMLKKKLKAAIKIFDPYKPKQCLHVSKDASDRTNFKSKWEQGLYACTAAYPGQLLPVWLFPLDWAATLCEWQAKVPASHCPTAGRWTAAGRSSDTPDWQHSSPVPGFVPDDAAHSSTASKLNISTSRQ